MKRRNNVNRNSSHRSEVRPESTRNNDREKVKTSSEKRESKSPQVNRSTRTQDGKSTTDNPQKRKGGRVTQFDSQRLRTIHQLCMGDRKKLQIRREEKEQQEIDAQIRRCNMSKEEKKFRRAALRLLGGIANNKSGSIEADCDFWWNQIKEKI